MTVFELLFLLVIAGITGSIGQSITGFSKRGCIVSVVVGFIGALIGSWISRELNLSEIFVINIGNIAFPVVWAVIGAVVFTGILSFLSSKNR